MKNNNCSTFIIRTQCSHPLIYNNQNEKGENHYKCLICGQELRGPINENAHIITGLLSCDRMVEKFQNHLSMVEMVFAEIESEAKIKKLALKSFEFLYKAK